MENSLPGFTPPSDHFSLRALKNAGIADFHADQERGNDFGAAADGCVHEMGQFEEGADFIVWRDRWARLRVVHRAILCAVLPADDSESERKAGQHHRSHCVAVRDAVLYGVWGV